MKIIFDYFDYKKYLNEKILGLPSKGRGVRLKLAQFLNCQTAYVSQVLNKDTNFSLEQGVRVNEFFDHNKEECKYFILLLQYERAGTRALQSFLREQLEEILEKRADVKKRVNITNSLSENFQHIYYSVWYYAAIHILLSIPEFQTEKAISRHLRIPLKKVQEVISFLLETGLAQQEGERYFIGQTRIHLDKNSIQIRRHHTNWRNQAIVAIDKNDDNDLHYSSVISMGRKDVSVVKEILLKAIEECRSVVKESPEEQLEALTIDLFKVY